MTMMNTTIMITRLIVINMSVTLRMDSIMSISIINVILACENKELWLLLLVTTNRNCIF